MRVLFNAQSLQSPGTRGRGIGRYVRNMLIGLCQARPTWSVTCVELGSLPPVDRDGLPNRLRFVTYDAPIHVDGAIRRYRWVNDRHFGDWVAKQPADVLVSGCVFEGDGVHAEFGQRRLPHLAVSHDLIPLIYTGYYLHDPRWVDFYGDRMQLLREVDVVLTNSESSALDFRRYMPHRRGPVVNVTGAVDETFVSPVTDADVRAKFQLHRPFVLCGGGNDWRKNVRRCLDAFGRLPDSIRRDFDIVVACDIGPDEPAVLKRRAEVQGTASALRLTGFVTDSELRSLYRSCRVFVFASLYEGLGLPVIEALRCGAPVVTSNCSSLPEYASPASWLVDPIDVDSIASGLSAALAEPRDLRMAERIAFAARFTPKALGERVARAIESCQPSPPRPRLAWVTIDQAIDEFWRDVLIRLGRDYVVDVVADFRPSDELAAVLPVIRPDELSARMANFEYARIVYLTDGKLPPMFGRFPGVVVATDPQTWKAARVVGPTVFLPVESVMRTAKRLQTILQDRMLIRASA